MQVWPAKGVLEAEATVRGNVPGLSRVYVQGVVTAAALNFMGSSGFFYISLIWGRIAAFSMIYSVHVFLRGLNCVCYKAMNYFGERRNLDEYLVF